MQLYIITGTTSGLGEALAKRLLASGRSVISVSRTLNESLTEYAKEKGAILTEYLCDLRETPNLVPFMERIMGMIDVSQLSSVTLVNNAGVLNPIMPLEQAGSEELTDHLHINLLAPMLLTSAFIRATGSWPVTVSKTVVNISSGAGKKTVFRLECLLYGQSGDRYDDAVRGTRARGRPRCGKAGFHSAGRCRDQNAGTNSQDCPPTFSGSGPFHRVESIREIIFAG